MFSWTAHRHRVQCHGNEVNICLGHVQGVANAGARLFSNPSGDYGSMVNERVGASNWTDGKELGDTWASRNAFSYGRGGERGAARPEASA